MARSLLILGGGNMGGAIARALARQSAYNVSLVEPDADKRADFSKLGITTSATLDDAPKAEMILVAMKPQQWQAAGEKIKNYLKDKDCLVLSIMAGISIAALQQVSPRVVRIMPNLPAIIGESMSVLAAPSMLRASDREAAQTMFEAIGQVAWVEDEEMLHAVTAVSGSGPGFVYAFMEALEQSAINLGLNAALAKKLITQTLCGSALLARASVESYAELRMKVTSKGGTTEAGLKALMTPHFQEAVEAALKAASKRSKTLSSE